MTDSTLDAIAPYRTAGALPSTRTEGMLHDALKSDAIEDVKLELAHTRAHYQSLEYMLNGLDMNGEGLINFAIDNGLIGGSQAEVDAMKVTLRLTATLALEQAYDIAHHVGFENLTDDLRAIYVGLDYSDPERDIQDDDLADALAKWEQELLDMAAEDSVGEPGSEPTA